MPSYILIEEGAPRVCEELPRFRATRLGVLGRFWEHVHAFDHSSRYRLSVRDAPKYGILSRILAYTVYSPSVELQSEWIRCGKYDKAAIIVLVAAGLEHDDDMIQQWFEAEDVINLLSAADSFDEMILAVKCVCGAHETDEAARQFVESVLSSRRRKRGGR